MLKDLEISGKALLVLSNDNHIFEKSSRNIKGINPITVGNLNIYDLLRAEWVVLEKSVVPVLEEVLK